LQFTDTDLRLP
jgi:hypothetical protein